MPRHAPLYFDDQEDPNFHIDGHIEDKPPMNEPLPAPPRPTLTNTGVLFSALMLGACVLIAGFMASGIPLTLMKSEPKPEYTATVVSPEGFTISVRLPNNNGSPRWARSAAKAVLHEIAQQQAEESTATHQAGR